MGISRRTLKKGQSRSFPVRQDLPTESSRSAKIFSILISAISIFQLSACAHSGSHEDPDLHEKLSKESSLRDYQSLRSEVVKTVDGSGHLTDEQKSRLVKLKEDTALKIDRLEQEIIRLKGALLKDLVMPKYDAKEVASIKKLIHSKDKEKSDIFFTALEKASSIVGPKEPSREELLERLHFDHPWQYRESNGL